MRARIVASTLALVVALAGCGGGDDETAAAIATLPDDAVPSEILDLTVEAEDVEERLEGAERNYVDATGLYSLREGDRLQATLQVARLNDEADVDDERFRLSIVNQIGSTEPKAFRMGESTVYLTASKRQSVAVFFEERSFVVLSTLETYESSRALLREVLELDL
jgi:hypothetical protein